MRKISDLLLSCGELLIRNKLSLAFAESATAGRIAAEFSLVPDAGKFLKGGLVCYDAALKTSILDVPEPLIRHRTPESPEVTHAIALGLQYLIPADIHIGCTGLTCPGGSETEDKPVGTMFIYGVRGKDLLFGERYFFEGSPEEIILKTIDKTASLLISSLNAVSNSIAATNY